MNWTKAILMVISCIGLISCQNKDPIRFSVARFNDAEWTKLNSSILQSAQNQRNVNISNLDESVQNSIKMLGVKRISLISKDYPRVCVYDLRYEGIATSGSTESLVFSEGAMTPIVADINLARESGDRTIVLHQKLSNNWFFRSTMN